MRKPTAAAVSAAVVSTAAGVGSRFGPTGKHPVTTGWYARLRKPSYTPPGPVFGLAWTVLDALLWFAGYRLFTRPAEPRRNIALGFWGLTMLGVGGFQWVLFGRKHLGEALGVSSGMVVTSAGLAAAAATVDRTAAKAVLPLTIWVAFAFLLQEEVWRRNSGRAVDRVGRRLRA